MVDGWSHYQVGTRALGGVNLVGGVLGVGVGLGLGGVSVETGVGPIAATGLLIYSTDHAYAGARTLWGGRPTPTLLQSALIKAGLPPNTVAYVDGALSLLTGVGTLSPATLRLPLREIGPIRDAEEVGQTGRALVPGEGGTVRGATGDVAGRLKEAYRPNWQGVPELKSVGADVTRGENGFAARMQDGSVVADKTSTVSGTQWNEYLTAKYGADNVFWDWPKNNGFVYGADKIGSLQPGQLIGRLGNERGTFVSPLGTAPETLSLRPGTDVSNLNVYRVSKEILNTRIGPSASAFDMPGYGLQNELPYSVKELLKSGHLERVTK